MFLTLFMLGVVFLLIFIYLNGKYNENYWNKRRVTFYKKNKVSGLMWDYMLQDRALFEILGDLHREYPNDPAVGVGSFLTPTLYVRDLKNVQHVLQYDFYSFNHRGADINEKDLLADNLLFMVGPRWKAMRQSMTPLFTATKLRNMYYIIDKSAQDFIDHLKTNPQQLKGNAFDTLNTFCSAAIGAAVFGIGTKSTYDSPFLEMARKSFQNTFLNDLKMSIANISPKLFKKLGFKVFGDYEDFFIDAIKQLIRNRERENVSRHDFADLCVSLQKKGTIRDQDTGLELEPTDELLAAQAFFFFIAGVEPCATAMFGTMIELGKHPDILQRIHNEVDRAFEKNNGKITYETLSEMEYLDNVLSEGLRMYPPIGHLSRQCVQDTVLPVGNIKIDKGTKIFTPIFDVHHDPKYYPNPEVFDPDRFDKNKNDINDITYMAFGKGNRLCIGMRYARLQVKAGLVHLLRHFTVKTVVSQNGMKYAKAPVQVRPTNVDLEFIPRKNI